MKNTLLNNWNEPQSASRVDLVFENRFKFYGAYELRKKYVRNKILALCITVFFLTGLFGSVFVYYKSKPEEKKIHNSPIEIPVKITETPIEEQPPIEIDHETQEQEIRIDQVNMQTPEIEPNAEFIPISLSSENISFSGTENVNEGLLAIPEEYTEFGQEFTQTTIQIEIPLQPDEEASFNWVEGPFEKFVETHFTYPERCQQEGIDGKVTIQFAVDKTGKILESYILPKLATTICPEFTAEAIRVLKLTQGLWTPGFVNGKPTTTYRVVNIQIRLNP